MTEPDDLFASDDGVIRIGRFGPVFAGVFHKGLTAKALDDVRHWQHGVMPEQKLISLSLSFAAQRLAPDVGQAADRLLAEFRDRTAASAQVMRAVGFEGSAARAMLATIYLLTRAAYPRKVFSSLAAGEAWLRSLSEDPDDHTAIDAASQWLSRFDLAPDSVERRAL